MNKPLLTLAGLALLGTAGVAGALALAPLGGDEEVVSQDETTGPTATVSPDPEGWVGFSHPGTAEAPPFSFAYPGNWHLQEPELLPRYLPKGEPLGTGVQVQLSSRDPSTVPSEAMPPDAIRLKVYVGPHAPLTICPPDEGSNNYRLAGIDGHRLVLGNPLTTLTVALYAYPPDLCYAIFADFSQPKPDEALLDQIAASFRVGQEVGTVSPNAEALVTSAPTSPSPAAVSTWKTFTNTAHGYSFQYPADWLIDPYDARNETTSDLVDLYNVMPPEVGREGTPPS